MGAVYNQILKFVYVLFFLIQASFVVAQTYVPPIGIPTPEFGIDETVESVYGSGTFYTHYVDNTHGSANDTANLFGTPEKPRMTIPKEVPPGSVVEIHGGPYTGAGGTYLLNGTAENPVFLRGESESDRPVISKSTIRLNGQYFIVENLDFYDKTPIRFSTEARYGSLRHSEVHNPPGSVGASNPTVSATGKHIVLYNNAIHDNHKADNLDCHGVQASNYGERIWVVDNQIYNNGGDGIQACHGCNPGPRYLYIGRNEFYGDKENGIDLKYASDVIISENVLHDYLLTAETGDVSPMVIGSDGAPTRVWILFNTIYNCRKGIRIEEIDDLWIIGNLIYDIQGPAIIPEKKGTITHILNNTIYNVETGISDPWREDFSLYIYNNVFSDVSKNSIKLGSAILEKSEISHNLFWNSSVHGENAINQDPQFQDALSQDFRLLETSPAVDGGTPRGGVIHEFYDLYGLDISYAIDGEVRPQGSEWDMGAYEFPTGTYPTQYILEVGNESGGIVTPSGGKYTSGSQIKLTATPEKGYGFNGWTGDLTGTDNPEFVVMDGDKSISASFNAVAEYNVTTNVTGSGTVSLIPPGGNYFVGTEISFTATPDPGFQFDNWSGDINDDQSPIQTVVSGDMSVTANFSVQNRPFIAYPLLGVTASSYESPNVPVNTLDGNTGTRWSAEGDQWIRYEMEEDDTISYVAISIHHGDQVRLSLDIDVSLDQENWIPVFSGLASGTTLQPEIYDFTDIAGQYVRVTGHGNNANQWNSLTTVNVVGLGDDPTGMFGFEKSSPGEFSLSAFPNPMQSETTIRINIPRHGAVFKLSVYNIYGQEIKKMVQGVSKPGLTQFNWNAMDNSGLKVSPGMYLLSLQVENQVEAIKINVIE
jgi:uncharacterized repeat protein (TIGR02543 family)